jgi:hypothetical protein
LSHSSSLTLVKASPGGGRDPPLQNVAPPPSSESPLRRVNLCAFTLELAQKLRNWGHPL